MTAVTHMLEMTKTRSIDDLFDDGCGGGAPARHPRPTSRDLALRRYLGWWIVQSTVRPSRASRWSTRATSSAALESSPLVGSSTNMTDGSVSSSDAIETRLRWPPDSPRRATSPIRVSRHSASPKSASSRSTCNRAARGRGGGKGGGCAARQPQHSRAVARAAIVQEGRRRARSHRARLDAIGMAMSWETSRASRMVVRRRTSRRSSRARETSTSWRRPPLHSPRPPLRPSIIAAPHLGSARRAVELGQAERGDEAEALGRREPREQRVVLGGRGGGREGGFV